MISQLGQDEYILSQIPIGFFVEFGVTDGVTYSNTLLLEKSGWQGIIVEPQKIEIRDRRCIIDRSCIWKTTGEKIIFNQTPDVLLSTIDSFSNCDLHDRQVGERYLVDTITLSDLLDKYNAPMIIDYLSIDTEGSEFDILNAFFPNRRQIRYITVEHNYTESKDKIYTLLTQNGYERIREVEWEDWYRANSG